MKYKLTIELEIDYDKDVKPDYPYIDDNEDAIKALMAHEFQQQVLQEKDNKFRLTISKQESK